MEEEGYEKKLVNSKMYFNMAETDIVLVEDMDTLHANALLLNVSPAYIIRAEGSTPLLLV